MFWLSIVAIIVMVLTLITGVIYNPIPVVLFLAGIVLMTRSTLIFWTDDHPELVEKWRKKLVIDKNK